MEVSGSSELRYDEEHALNTLLDAFGSVFSLKDIASAYCEANRNVDVAGEILFKMQENPSFVDTSASNGKAKSGEAKQIWRQVSSASNSSNDELKKDELFESSSSNSLQNSFRAIGDFRTQKQKWRPVSGGTVSSMLGKGYMKPAPSANSSNPRTKPLKVDSKEWPMSVLWGEECKSSSLKENRLHKDMEDFLFKMLGLGFQLERNVIREVLDNCGYDMQKSMEKLLDRSAAGLDEGSKFLGESNKKVSLIFDISQFLMTLFTCRNKVLNANGGARQSKDRNEIQKEVLTALFNNGLERFDESPPRRTRSAKRSIALGELVEGPLLDSVVKEKVDSVGSDKKDDEEEEEDSFQVLRRAVEEYRGTMKEYYKAAIEAFAKGDQGLANRFLEQGQFYREKARQADEESNQKIFDTRLASHEDEMSLDLHDHGAKEAIRLLKCHLSSLAGIPSFKYLKIIVDKNEDDSLKGSRRRLVMRLLEKESITWTEGETFGIIRIQLDNINPKNLSFAKKNPSL
ncbi:YPL199C protein [Hibiscus syriacus]|uniref:YPL199C protein n=1 Tax=Hibiscus syriacus TaxID=106335 RepID=A0A6A2XLC6_HIBSY|nr:YPL199C protein [Hibiscus syriacus]